MLQVLDKKHFETLKGKKLACVYRYSKDEWRCMTPRGNFVYVKFKAGILAVTTSTREYDLGNKVMLVGSMKQPAEDDFAEIDWTAFKASKKGHTKAKEFEPWLCKTRLSFGQIMTFLEWKCDDDQIWDEYN
tara:strand:+ start:1088 stop:1480 length:393 start_codon:yes stop_codon:yes gene_type:complete